MSPWCSYLCFWDALKVSQQKDEQKVLEVSLQRAVKEANCDCKCSALPEGVCRRFSLAEIKAVTKNFDLGSVIGHGFGPVYRGTADDGNGTMAVAVKRCINGYLIENVRKAFKNEVKILCQLRHPNLVSLIGFCEDQNEMILVYEYMSKGSLSNYLFGRGCVPLSWRKRLHICIGAARGLHYLHTGSKYALLHGHIKSLNILLEEEMSAKLHAFGLAKVGPRSTSKAALVWEDKRILGSYGYMAPEYTSLGELTEKYDVYGFGIVLFEVLFGRRAYDDTLPQNQQNILDWAAGEHMRKGTIYRVIDPYLRGRIAPACFKKYLELACSCVHHDRNERPAMGEVEVTLELALELQEKADSEPYGELSFSTSNSYFEFNLDRSSGNGREDILLA